MPVFPRFGALLGALLLPACGSDSSGSDAAKSTDVSVFDGTWQSECISTGGGVYVRATMTNKAPDTKVESAFYNSATCGTPLGKDTDIRTWVAVGPADGIEGAVKVNITHVRESSVLLVEETLAAANEKSMYGYTDWKVDEEKDTTGRARTPEAKPEYAAGQVTYNIYKIDADGQLVAGDSASGDGSTEAKRSTALATTVRLKKQ